MVSILNTENEKSKLRFQNPNISHDGRFQQLRKDRGLGKDFKGKESLLAPSYHTLHSHCFHLHQVQKSEGMNIYASVAAQMGRISSIGNKASEHSERLIHVKLLPLQAVRFWTRTQSGG